uniref:Ribosomal protein S19 n=1 Tax=Babesia orientalis TaxID=273649 RepID=A0A0M4MEA2_9APIC|nr:ribosomal protein S19 [Babesia orientalis]ALE29376.1 ribosomal protein S19 [Babesia orientalis]
MTLYTNWKKIFISTDIYLKLKNKNYINKYFVVKTYNRNILISSLFNDSIIKVYNGKKFIPIKITSLKFNFKYRFFIPTLNKH